MAIRQLSDGNDAGQSLGQSTADLISFYGLTPISQRGGAVQAQSLLTANSYVSVTSNLAAILSEVGLTLQAYGLWKGAA